MGLINTAEGLGDGGVGGAGGEGGGGGGGGVGGEGVVSLPVGVLGGQY